MLFRLRRTSQTWRARPDFARILKTPPLAGRDDGAIVFSQLQHKDVLAYLVAAKSFAHSTGYGRFALLDDGTLTAEDRGLLRRHLPRIEFRTMSEVHYGNLPAGGTWERLITICDLAERDFVIQLDADTVTCGPLDEVKACVARGHSFTLMAGHTAEILPLAQIAELANTFTAAITSSSSPKACSVGSIRRSRRGMAVVARASPALRPIRSAGPRSSVSRRGWRSCSARAGANGARSRSRRTSSSHAIRTASCCPIAATAISAAKR